MAGDEADVVLVSGAPGHPRDHLAADDDGARRGLVAQLLVGHGHVPHQPARARVQRDEVGVVGRAEDQVAVDRHVALDAAPGVAARGRRPLRQARNVRLLTAAAASGHRRGRRRARPVFPDQRAGCRIERLDDAARVGQVHHAVVDERRRLLRARVVHRPRPGQLQLPDVLARDLVQRTVAPRVVGAPPVQPLARRRVAEHRLGDREKRPVLALQEERARQQYKSDRECEARQHGHPSDINNLHAGVTTLTSKEAAMSPTELTKVRDALAGALSIDEVNQLGRYRPPGSSRPRRGSSLALLFIVVYKAGTSHRSP